MYTNIPAKNITTIIRNKQNTITEIVSITHTVLSQNYFQFTDEFYGQDGLAVGTPSFAILAEIYLAVPRTQ
jgi:hypothetical protein